MNEMNDILNFDSLSEAEKITGKSYKSNEETAGLGLLLHLAHTQNLREEMALRDDTYHGCPFTDTLRILQDEGFVSIHQHFFWGHNKETETFEILHHEQDGILATVCSYGKSTNSAKIYYNWKPNVDKYWQYTSSGHMIKVNEDNIWIGHHDIRNALRHTLATLRDNGDFFTPWVERPFLWLLDYSQEKEVGYEYGQRQYEVINEALIKQFPQNVQKALDAPKRFTR